MKQIRVLQVIGIMNRAGAEALIMNLYRAVDRNAVQFDFVEHGNAPAVYDQEIQELGGRIYRCPKFTGKNILTYRKWWEEFFKLHADKYEVIHGHIGSTASIYLSVAKKYGLFTIAHSHNTNGPLNPKELLYRLLSYPTRYTADYFFSCSRQAGIDRYGKKIADNPLKLSILNNAVNTKKFSYNPEQRNKIRSIYGLDDTKLVIGHVGRFAPAKNHEYLIEIFKAVHHENQNAVLLMVGDGELRSSIEDKVREYGLSDCVIFAGIQEKVNEYMSAMDILVFPSIFEGLPVTLVEAQTSGLHCIISDNIPADAVIVPEIVKALSLEEKPEFWAEQIREYHSHDREQFAGIVRDRGFDVESNALKLMNYYIEKSNFVKEERSKQR